MIRSYPIFLLRLPLFLCLVIFSSNACTIIPSPKGAKKNLVSQDNPIFDKRFKELSLKDIDLSHFWRDVDVLEERQDVPITNNTFAEIVDKSKDGVVNIFTRQIIERKAKFGIHPNDILPIRLPLISSILEVVPFQVPIPFRTNGISLGSGFIINKQGYILTNAHVIHNATDISVVFSEGDREYPAKIIGQDMLTDTALIKIQPERELTVLTLADSDRLKMGEIVIAMGNPLGLTHTVTSGLVSAKDRVMPGSNNQVLDFIQTDSAINPGNSGGPLLNLYGEVVGINTAIISEAQLIGFAIPINNVKEVIPLLVLGKTERGWMGIAVRPLSIESALDLGFSNKNGILINEVEKGSPAEKAGLKEKDIIVKLNNQEIRNFLFFSRKLLGMLPGQTLQFTIFRGGEIYEISTQLAHKKKK